MAARLHGLERPARSALVLGAVRAAPWFALLMAIVAPAVLAAALGFMFFRSRVQGVYFSIITQALALIATHALRRPAAVHRRHQRPDQLHARSSACR